MKPSNSGSSANNRRQIGVIQSPLPIPSFILQSQLPIDLWLPLTLINQDTVSIISVNSPHEQISMMSTLSKTCRFFRDFYHEELEKQAAKKLLQCFFMPTEENVKKAMIMILANPKLIFIKIKNGKSIKDIRGRCFEGSFLQAAMQAKAVGWLNWLKKEVIDKTNTHDEATRQYQEKFGQPDERKKRMLKQLDIDLSAINVAFRNDPCTNARPTLAETFHAFEAMRQHLMEENQPDTVIQTGEFFPLNIIQKIYDMYDNRWNNWNGNQLMCYSRYVLGFAQQFCETYDLLRLLKKLITQNNDQVPLFGDFKQTITHDNHQYDLDFLQLNKYPDFQLGIRLFIDPFYGISWSAGGPWREIGAHESVLTTYISNKNKACNAYAHMRPELVQCAVC